MIWVSLVRRRRRPVVKKASVPVLNIPGGLGLEPQGQIMDEPDLELGVMEIPRDDRPDVPEAQSQRLPILPQVLDQIIGRPLGPRENLDPMGGEGQPFLFGRFSDNLL